MTAREPKHGLLCALRIYGVESARGGIAQQIDVLFGIRPCAHGPNNICQIRRIDIVVDNHDITTKMSGSRLALRGQVCSLSRVSWEALLYRYHRKKKFTPDTS